MNIRKSRRRKTRLYQAEQLLKEARDFMVVCTEASG